MRITTFYPSVYTLSFEVDGKEIAVDLPRDQFLFDEVQRRVMEQHGTLLPHMTQEQFGGALERFIRDCIAQGRDIGPVGVVNRIVRASLDA